MQMALRSALSLTLSRILLGPLFMAVYLYYESFGIKVSFLPYILLALVAVSELSDIFDGMIARKANQVTDLGKLLDPMADTIFRMSVFLSFSQGFLKIPLLLVIVFFYRESVIATLRTLCALRGVTLAARLSGKIKAIIQAVVAVFVILLMIPYNMGSLSYEHLYSWSCFAIAYIKRALSLT